MREIKLISLKIATRCYKVPFIFYVKVTTFNYKYPPNTSFYFLNLPGNRSQEGLFKE